MDRVSATSVPTGERTDLHRPGSAGYRRLNAAMGLAGLAAFGILYCTQPLLPDLSEQFGVGPTRAALSVSAATGALAVFVLPATAVAVRLGRIRSIGLGLLVATVLTALAAVAPTYDVLVVLRLLAGVALAAVVAVAMGHVASQVHPSGLGAAMGLYVAGNSLGGVGGRVVTSAVVDLTGWRWAVGALAALALLATAGFWRLVPEPVAHPVTASTRQRRPGGSLLALLRDPAVAALVAVPFLLMGAFVATYNYLTYRLVEAPFGLPSAVVGLVFLAYLGGTVSSAVAGRLADRLGRPRVLAGATVVMAAGILLTLPGQLALVVAGLVVLTVGFFGAHATASGWAPVVGASAPARTSAAYVASYYAGSSVFGALVGLAWHAGGWGATAASVLVLVGLGLLAGLAVPVALARRAVTDRPRGSAGS